MNLKNFTIKKNISSVFDFIIVLSFILMCLLCLTDGFIYNLFGLQIRVSNYKNLLLVISILWFVKKIFFTESENEIRHFFKKVSIFISVLLILILLNFLIYGYYQRGFFEHDVKKIDFNSYKKISYPKPDLTTENKGWNVILISIDTLRADHLGCYGYARNTSLHINNLATQGVLFREHIAPAPSTLPSHASMFTSLNPFTHKAEWVTSVPLDSKIVTLAEVLRKENFRTVAFTGGGQISKIYGVDQGFQIYDDEGGGIAPVLQKTLDWLRGNKDKRFFLFFHTYEVHHPYVPPKSYDGLFYPEYNGKLGNNISIEMLKRINKGKQKIDENDRKHIVAQYDEEIVYMDEQLNKLFEELKYLKIWDKTLIVFTSDHGEEFNEHGKMGWHSHTLYDELLKIPLIIRFPDNSYNGTIIEQQTRGIDIFPTIVDILNITPPNMIQGTSLVPLITNPEAKMFLPALSEGESGGNTYKLRKSLRFKDNKFIFLSSVRSPSTFFEKFLSKMFFFRLDTYVRKRELYNIRNDPMEKNNIFRNQRPISRQYESKILELREENSLISDSFKAEKNQDNKKLLKKLRALGYL